MYSKCQELGIPIISDTGTLSITDSKNRDFPKIYYGEPINFTEVLESFPRLTLVMCHLASAFWDERVEMAQRYKNLFFDVSGGFNPPDKVLTNSPLVARDGRRAAAEEDAVRIIRKVGPHRIIFGSDGPGIMVQPAIEQILRLGLTDEEKRMILSENAKRIYRI
jgi:predicted TIM-barrel fold metal-dependent hydrolase